MRLLVQYPDGSVQAAMLIAIFGGDLRVAIPACDDAVEFRWASGQWLAETGDAVQIQFDAAPEGFYWWAGHAGDMHEGSLHPQMVEPWVVQALRAPMAAAVN